ncbi:MAG TPA: branched-chain amino acid aminotransferase [Syntrophorhabdaceae bacterium]|nr:branched-chain amino acid aminotransferase [Syntrophorhabdaceae bacterium]HOS05946.1 branched-chain amino acid aminotransferase [Syntrophorhabdaceae bacterium]HPL41878.1 branched-chain amino acid aminotransferase [Syntrophorhabdaceae bacterium]
MKIEKTLQSKRHGVDFENLKFGERFSDHMASCEYRDDKWQTPEIIPFGNISVSPAMCCFHYGQMVFEGIKAFYAGDRINIFRPEKYHERHNRSCKRLCIPYMDQELFLSVIKALVTLDIDWVPRGSGTSLYIRPFVFATENFLGVKVSDTYRFMVITSPVGAYYKEGLNPVKLITSGAYTRAARGGLGEVKTPANYAASLFPAEEAKNKGYTQVLWLDGIEDKFIEEVGTMNICFVINDILITPSLDGTILPGITRDSVIFLAKEWGIKIEERPISIYEVIDASKKGTLQEAFGTGTAAVISPVGEIRHKDEIIMVNNGRIGELSQKFYDEITGIQYGKLKDKYGWTMSILL